MAAGLNRVGKSNGDDVGKLASGKQEQESSELTDDKQFLVEELENTDVPEEFKDAEELTEGNITYRMIDSTDSGKMVFVIHCAAVVYIKSQYNSFVYNVNVNGTKNIVAKVLKTKAKLIYIYSCYFFSIINDSKPCLCSGR